MASQEEVLVKKIAYLQSLDKDLDALENELKALTVTWRDAVSVNECKKRKGNFGAAIKTYLDLFIKLKDEKFFY